MKKVFLIVFGVATAAVLTASLGDMRWLHTVSKPLLMSSMLLYYLTGSAPVHRSRSVALAIVFSLAGDVLLMDGNHFTLGLLAFLIAHIFYIFAYRQHQHEETDDSLRGIHRMRLAFPVILAGSGLIVILYPVLGDMRIPVIVYAAVITAMVLVALFRFGRTSAASFWMVFGGAVLFLISDSVIAVNKFLTPVNEAEFIILATYCAAQFLIVNGLLRHPQS